MLLAPVFALCLLSVAAFAESDNASSAASTSPDSGLPDPSLSNESDICVDDSNCRGLSYCDTVSGICLECIECCATKRRDCPRLKCHCHWFLTDEELKIVAQAVLGVAVFVTCVALLSLLWKICARRLRQRRAAAAGVDLLDDTVSLSSQQVFVVERLRDRPPRYEDAARDIAIEKPPPYMEVACLQVAQTERPPQTVLVGGVPVTLVAGGLMARDFMAPPPYSPTPARTAATAPLAPPQPPATPPIRRLRRCVRKVVMISRLARRSVTAPEADRGSRPPKGASPRQSETLRSPPGLSGAAGLATTATAGSEAVVTAHPQSEAAAVLPVSTGPVSEEFGRVPDSPTSTMA